MRRPRAVLEMGEQNYDERIEDGFEMLSGEAKGAKEGDDLRIQPPWPPRKWSLT